MGKIKTHPPVKLIAAVTLVDSSLWDQIKAELEGLFSPIDLQTSWYNFSQFTNYYRSQMGEQLTKCMLSFQTLVLPEQLPDIKIATNELESRFIQEGKRRINLDPGYICAAKLVLATTKDYDHRVYIGRGIYGDVHLRYRHHHFQPNEWTYPDYRQDFVIAFFEKVREIYLQQLSSYGEI